MAKQIYDADGTTFYSCSVMVAEDGKAKRWTMAFTQGEIGIFGTSTGLTFRMTYPKDEHWVYECLEPIRQDMNKKRGGQIKNSKFSLEIWITEPYTEEEAEFVSDYSLPDGELILTVGGQTMSSNIPYTFAVALMKFASGSTDIEGATRITKY